ncbi:unnamed protein product [Symbiodinium microadriaticum]|nr:unnamed protein product [Symbiodinium microadriaticum]
MQVTCERLERSCQDMRSLLSEFEEEQAMLRQEQDRLHKRVERAQRKVKGRQEWFIDNLLSDMEHLEVSNLLSSIFRAKEERKVAKRRRWTAAESLGGKPTMPENLQDDDLSGPFSDVNVQLSWAFGLQKGGLQQAEFGAEAAELQKWVREVMSGDPVAEAEALPDAMWAAQLAKRAVESSPPKLRHSPSSSPKAPGPGMGYAEPGRPCELRGRTARRSSAFEVSQCFEWWSLDVPTSARVPAAKRCSSGRLALTLVPMKTAVLALLCSLYGILAQELRGGRRAAGPDAEHLLPKPDVTVAHGLYESSCEVPGEGTKQVARGPGGCVNAQPGLAGFKKQQQTVMSFLVEPCGLVAPHLHANSVEINTVIRGAGVIGQLTTDTNELELSEVSEGDSFFFAQAAYHWWVNLGEEPLITIGAFFNTDDPDTALVGFDDGVGLVGTLMQDMPLLNTMVGRSSGRKNTVPLNEKESPLFPKLTPEACAAARSSNRRAGKESFQKNPSGTNMFQPGELRSGKFGLTAADTPVSCPKPPCGGGLRPLAGEVASRSEGVAGTASSQPSFDGGLSFTANGGGPPPPAFWPGLTNVAGGKSLVKFVVSYCGIVSAHTHPNAAEWNTVISGAGQVSYYRTNTGDATQLVTMDVKKGDTFVFPQGTVHWWVNYSPTEQLATVGGFSAAFPDTSLLSELFRKTEETFPFVNDAVLGEDFVPSAATAGGNLFPLLPNRQPAGCGGDTPCTSCV